MQDAKCLTSLGKSLIAVSLLSLSAEAGFAQHASCTHDIRQIENHGSGSSASIDANFACLLDELAKAQDEIERLRSEIATVRSNGTDGRAALQSAMIAGQDAISENMQSFQQPIPEGAVVAFDRSDLDENTCPTGWEPFRKGRGRFLIGAGSPGAEGDKYEIDENGEEIYNYSTLEHGGAAQIEVRQADLPAHSHPVTRGDREEILFKTYPIRDVDDGALSILSQTGDVALFSFEAGNQPNAPSVARFNNMPPYIALYFCRKV